MKKVLWSIGFISMATFAHAQESRTMQVGGGMLCDTQGQLEVLLTGISLSGGKNPEPLTEGCGQFTPPVPVPMTMTPIAVYETPMATSLIARFVHEETGWVQYGWVSYNINPNYSPPDRGEPA